LPPGCSVRIERDSWRHKRTPAPAWSALGVRHTDRDALAQGHRITVVSAASVAEPALPSTTRVACRHVIDCVVGPRATMPSDRPVITATGEASRTTGVDFALRPLIGLKARSAACARERGEPRPVLLSSVPRHEAGLAGLSTLECNKPRQCMTLQVLHHAGLHPRLLLSSVQTRMRTTPSQR
jgi:hypothetical protein